MSLAAWFKVTAVLFMSTWTSGYVLPVRGNCSTQDSKLLHTANAKVQDSERERERNRVCVCVCVCTHACVHASVRACVFKTGTGAGCLLVELEQ